MNPANKAILEDYRQYWLTLKNAGYMMGLSGHVRDEMVRIMGEEFRPGYTADLWCPPCVADMVTALYFEFEKWEAAQPPVVAEEPPGPDDSSAIALTEQKSIDILSQLTCTPDDLKVLVLHPDTDVKFLDFNTGELVGLPKPIIPEVGVVGGPEPFWPIEPDLEREGFDEARLIMEDGALSMTAEEEPKAVEPTIEEPPIELPPPPPVEEPTKPRIVVKSAFPSNKPKGRK